MSGIKRQERIKANKEKRRLKREQVAQERAWARDACCALGRRARFCRSAGQTPDGAKATVLPTENGLLLAKSHHPQVYEGARRMAGSPERLKPRHIAVQGLRILLLRMVDELRTIITAAILTKNQIRGNKATGPFPSSRAWLIMDMCPGDKKSPAR